MSYQNRIQAIHMRMQEIQARFGSGPVGSGMSSVKTGQMDPAVGQGVTFEQILATKMKDSPVSENKAVAGTSSAPPSDFDPIINEAAQKYNLDPDFLKAVIKQESGFNPKATSWVGAMGLMQLMPETAKDLGVKNGYDPADNVMGGAKYLRQQMDTFGGDMRKTLAAYNAGPGAVQKYGGIPPYKETQNYVANIMAIYEGYKSKNS